MSEWWRNWQKKLPVVVKLAEEIASCGETGRKNCQLSSNWQKLPVVANLAEKVARKITF